jgi:DNA invertase Pin-like site-specific DNA recombinase
MMAFMKTAIYCRTSTNKQDKGLESQVRYLSEYCNQKDISNFLTYKDFGVSGKKSSRPGLNQLLSNIRSGNIKTVIVYSFSRFARSTQHLLEALEEFDKLGVTFISVSENIDTNTPMGKAMFTIISALAQLERELIVERVKLGLANARAKGKILGRKKTRNSDLIQELRRQGLSYRKIARLAKCSISTVHRELSVPKVTL